jgi:hypothetical protein
MSVSSTCHVCTCCILAFLRVPDERSHDCVSACYVCACCMLLVIAKRSSHISSHLTLGHSRRRQPRTYRPCPVESQVLSAPRVRVCPVSCCHRPTAIRGPRRLKFVCAICARRPSPKSGQRRPRSSDERERRATGCCGLCAVRGDRCAARPIEF